MTKPSLHLLMSLGTSLVLAAGCGDDGAGTDGGTTTATTGEDTTGSSPTSDPTSNPTTPPTSTDPTTTGNSESNSSTEDTTSVTGTTGTDETATTGTDETATTGAVETASTTEESGTTLMESTGGETAGETTTGESTTGEDTSTGEDTTTGNAEECLLAAQHLPCDANSNEPLHALGLNCTSLGGDYVNNQNAVTVTDYDFQAPAALFGKRTWQVAKSYGTYIDPNTNAPFWRAREGDKMLMISSGLLENPNNAGAVILDDGDVYNDTTLVGGVWDSDVMPPPMKQNTGSPDPMGFTNCDGVNDCSNTLQAQWELGEGNPNDKMWFSFKLKAPSIANGDVADANGYTFDFAYFSAEFPEFVDTEFNDIFVVWQDSEAYTGNVTFIDGQPMTVTALWPIDFEGECDINPSCGDAHLAGTGMQDDGGATGWYKATGGVMPGETFTLAFAVFDMGDSDYDTTALIDNWQWDCEGCVPNEVMSCGIEPDPM